MSEHIVKAYGEELSNLAAEVARMGGIAEIVHYEITGEDLPAERPKGDALRKKPEGGAA